MSGIFMKKNRFMILMLCSIALLVCTATAGVISIENGQVTATGNTATVDLILDSAPRGLGGYNMNVTIADPAIAAVTAVSFPSWAGMTKTCPFPSTDCRISVVDLNHLVQPGATNVPLATLTIKGLRSGSTPVTVTVNLMNDDDEVLMQPAILPGTFTVTGSEKSQASAPEFPTAVLSLLLVIGSIGTVRYLRRTRNN